MNKCAEYGIDSGTAMNLMQKRAVFYVTPTGTALTPYQYLSTHFDPATALKQQRARMAKGKFIRPSMYPRFFGNLAKSPGIMSFLNNVSRYVKVK